MLLYFLLKPDCYLFDVYRKSNGTQMRHVSAKEEEGKLQHLELYHWDTVLTSSKVRPIAALVLEMYSTGTEVYWIWRADIEIRRYKQGLF